MFETQNGETGKSRGIWLFDKTVQLLTANYYLSFTRTEYREPKMQMNNMGYE